MWSIFLTPFNIQSGKFLSTLPVDPKLGKMLIMGAIFRCFDPVLTIVSGLSVRDPFLLPQEKKDVSTKFNMLPLRASKYVLGSLGKCQLHNC